MQWPVFACLLCNIYLADIVIQSSETIDIYVQATARGEEGMTLFFVCCNPNCGHRWRDWDHISVMVGVLLVLEVFEKLSDLKESDATVHHLVYVKCNESCLVLDWNTCYYMLPKFFLKKWKLLFCWIAELWVILMFLDSEH